MQPARVWQKAGGLNYVASMKFVTRFIRELEKSRGSTSVYGNLSGIPERERESDQNGQPCEFAYPGFLQVRNVKDCNSDAHVYDKMLPTYQ